jgi:hypothetical protein
VIGGQPGGHDRIGAQPQHRGQFVEVGFRAVESYAGEISDLDGSEGATRRHRAWRLGIGADVLESAQRRREIGNFLASLSRRPARRTRPHRRSAAASRPVRRGRFPGGTACPRTHRAWRLGIGADVLESAQRRREIGNFLASLSTARGVE